MKHVRYFCVLRFLHLDDNKEDPDKMDDNYDDVENENCIGIAQYAKYYSPTAHLAGAEIIMLFRGKVIFNKYVL